MLKKLSLQDIKYIVNWDNHFSLKQLENMISNINYFHYGIFNDQVVVGYILASVSDDVDLVWIYVESEYRHQGYATRLMNTLVKTYENKTIWLEVNKNNDVAITLYKKIGFICTHERLNYYPNKDTAIIMKKQNKAKKQN